MATLRPNRLRFGHGTGFLDGIQHVIVLKKQGPQHEALHRVHYGREITQQVQPTMKSSGTAWAYFPFWGKVTAARSSIDSLSISLRAAVLVRREYRNSLFILWRPFVWLGHSFSTGAGYLTIGMAWCRLLFWHALRLLFLVASLAVVAAAVLTFTSSAESDFGTPSRVPQPLPLAETSSQPSAFGQFISDPVNWELPIRAAAWVVNQSGSSESAKPIHVKEHYRSRPNSQNE